MFELLLRGCLLFIVHNVNHCSLLKSETNSIIEFRWFQSDSLMMITHDIGMNNHNFKQIFVLQQSSLRLQTMFFRVTGKKNYNLWYLKNL